ncbi:IS110 family transposase [Chloroflexi bacterium TSY]|nr:IS110 family transposase [Chloroflexi bacterium TSY]
MFNFIFIQSSSRYVRSIDLLRSWPSYGITHVAMESTGVYWKPIYNVA